MINWGKHKKYIVNGLPVFNYDGPEFLIYFFHQKKALHCCSLTKFKQWTKKMENKLNEDGNDFYFIGKFYNV